MCFEDTLLFISDGDRASNNEMMRWFTARLGVSDMAWNMISLNTQLHRWWGMAYLGFKYQGILPGPTDEQRLIRVQFHWMPRRLSDERDEEDIRAHLQSTWASQQGVAAFRTTGRPVATGDVFDVVVAAEDAFRMRRALELQWVLIRVAALAGAADIYADAVDSDDSGSLEEGLIEETPDISSWLDNAVPGPPESGEF
jgi:hypothetical protein